MINAAKDDPRSFNRVPSPVNVEDVVKLGSDLGVCAKTNGFKAVLAHEGASEAQGLIGRPITIAIRFHNCIRDERKVGLSASYYA